MEMEDLCTICRYKHKGECEKKNVTNPDVAKSSVVHTVYYAHLTNQSLNVLSVKFRVVV